MAVKYQELVKRLKMDILGGKYGTTHPLPSIQALMRRTGFSKNTVIRALDELKVQGFISNSQGRVSLVTKFGAARKIGLIVPGIAYSEFFPPIVSAITRLAQKSDYMILIGEMKSQSARERAVWADRFARKLVNEHAAGVIYHPLEFLAQAEQINRRIVSIFDRAGIPVVLLDNDMSMPPNRSPYDVVGINDHDAGFRLADHLIAQGARNIHFLMRPYWAVGCHNRCHGLITAVATSAKRCSYGVLTAEPNDVPAIRRYVRRHRPDAFVCGNDTTAAIFKQTLEGLGYAIPRDLLLAGFDDIQIASLLTPGLTTIHNPSAEIGQKAFETLLARMARADAPPSDILLPAPLVVRGSTQKTV